LNLFLHATSSTKRKVPETFTRKDLMGVIHLVMTSLPKKRSKRRVPTQIRNLLTQALGFFLDHNFEKAIELYLEIIKLSPATTEPYDTLGIIYEEVSPLIPFLFPDTFSS
jgi:hypothetical protein